MLVAECLLMFEHEWPLSQFLAYFGPKTDEHLYIYKNRSNIQRGGLGDHALQFETFLATKYGATTIRF